MALTDIFIKRPVLSVVVSLLILLIGLRAASVLPIRQYPKLSNTVVNVTTVYPGASASLTATSVPASSSPATAVWGRSATPSPCSTIFFAASMLSSSMTPRGTAPAPRKNSFVSRW